MQNVGPWPWCSPARAWPIEAGSSTEALIRLDGPTATGEHQFEMVASSSHPQVVHRTACICLRTTPAQAKRCYQPLRAAGDVGLAPGQQPRSTPARRPGGGRLPALCQLTNRGGFGELSVVGARSVLQRYSDAWFEAARRHNRGAGRVPAPQTLPGPIRFYNGTFFLDGDRRAAAGRQRPSELWVRLTRPLPYLPDQVRSVTLLHDAGRLWLSVTAAVPVEQHDLDPDQVSGVDLGIIHPYAVVTQDAGLLVSGRGASRELPAPQGPAGSPGQSSRAGSQGRATRVAPLASTSAGPAAGRGPPPPPRSPGPPPGRPPGHRIRDCPPGGNLGGG